MAKVGFPRHRGFFGAIESTWITVTVLIAYIHTPLTCSLVNMQGIHNYNKIASFTSANDGQPAAP